MPKEKPNIKALSIAISAQISRIKHGEMRIIVVNGEVVDTYVTEHKKPHTLIEENTDELLTEYAK